MMLAETLRAAIVIARRDFRATVMSKSFLFFLLAPLFPLVVGLLFSNLGNKIQRDMPPPVLAVSFSAADAQRFERAYRALLPVLGSDERPPLAVEYVPFERGSETDRNALIHRKENAVVGVLDGSLSVPRLTGALEPDGRTIRVVSVLVEEARRQALLGNRAGTPGLPLTVDLIQQSSRSAERGRELTARAGQALQFLLTLLLAGMLLSQLVEEKSNKVIEVLAAAVPIDSIFLGKLFAMLAVSLTGIALWGSAAALALARWYPGGLSALPEPALGWPAFGLLWIVYFSMSYLLLGAAFLGIGAQATTVREVQTMSMPVTMSQMLIFALCTAAVGRPDSQEGWTAAIFPFSSPFAMLARAAEQPLRWTHVAALLWQVGWVLLILRISSDYFRRTVLKSGPASGRWWKARRRGV
jgi:ABC-2 type transport system permease protein